MDIEDEATRALLEAGIEKILGGFGCDHLISAGLDQQLQRGADGFIVVHHKHYEFSLGHGDPASLREGRLKLEIHENG